MRRNKKKEDKKGKKGKDSPKQSPRGGKSPRDKSPSLRDTHVVHGDGADVALPWSMDLDQEEFFREAMSRLTELGALTTDGIFRVAGANDAVSQMKTDMEDGKSARDVLSACSDVHDVSTCLGRWLRDQPMMIPPEVFSKCDALVAEDADGPACEAFVKELDEPGQTLLRLLLSLLQQVDAQATRMTPDNLSRVFALTIIKRDDPMEMAQHVTSDAAFVSHLIQRLPVPPVEEELVDEDGGRSPTPSPSPLARAESTPAKIAREEAERLAELDKLLDDPELKDAGMNKGGKRQTLVAERLRLVRNAEERKKKETLRRLLAEGVINHAVQKMRRPLAAPGELTADFATHKDDLELLLATELGREDLAKVLERLLSPGPVKAGKDTIVSTDPPGTASFPAEGFDCLCGALDMALSEMSDASAPIFDVFVACQWGGRASIVHHVDFPRQEEPGEAPGGVEHFCFPVDPTTISDGELPPNYTIVRTLDDGTRQYGFCKTIEVEDESDGSTIPEVLCLLSRHPWFSLFESVMEPLAEARLNGGYNAAGRLLDSLFKHATQTFPMPGERFRVSRRKADDLFLTRPNDESLPLADADCCELFKCLGVSGVMAIFKAMMVEGHCVFVSKDFHKLGVCAQAAASLLYPFVWQHIFVPILPRSWIDYITAPMPFICGVHDSMLDEVLQQPIEDAMVFMKLDTGDIMTAGEAQGTLPQVEGAKLEKILTKLLSDLNKDRILPDDFNAGVSDAFTEFMLDVFGGYRPHVLTASSSSDDTFELDVEKFTESFEDQSTQAFVRGVQGSQMFDIWCRERCELKRNDYPQVGLFETKLAERETMAGGAATFQLKAQANKDVTTARRLVHASDTLTNQNAGATSTVLQHIRRLDLWKNKSLWEDMFEDGLDDALMVKLHVVTDGGSMMGRTRSHSAAEAPSFAKKGGGARRRASVVVGSHMPGANQTPKAVTLSDVEQEFCGKVVEFAEVMMKFGLPLDLVMKFAESSTERHKISSVGGVKDTILNEISPRHAHIQKVMKEGWLDVEGKKKWDRRWFAIRGTSLCLYDKHDSKEPDTAFPCGACEVLEPKNSRKGHDAVFRINVAEYAVGSSTATSGTKSNTSALKFIVDAEDTADRHSWYRAFDNAGATIPPASKAIIEDEQRRAEEAEDEEDGRPMRRPRSLSMERKNSPSSLQKSPSKDFAETLNLAGGAMLEEEEDSEDGSEDDSDGDDAQSPVAQQEEMARLRADLVATKQALAASQSKEVDASASAKSAQAELSAKTAEADTLRADLARAKSEEPEPAPADADAADAAPADDTALLELKAENAALVAQLEAAKAASAEAEVEADGLKSELAAAQAVASAAGDADEASAALQVEVTRLGKERDEAVASLADKAAAYETLSAEQEGLKSAQAEAAEVHTSTVTELAAAQALAAAAGDASATSAALQAEVARLGTELAETKQALSAAEAKTAEATTRVSVVEGELVAKSSALEQTEAAHEALVSHHAAHEGTSAGLHEETVSLRAQLEASATTLTDERETYSNQLRDLRAQIEEMHTAHTAAQAKQEQELAQLNTAHKSSLERELASLRRTHTLELESMRETLSEALATDAANAVEREQLRRAAEREASRHRLARTLESELKAIAGAMDDGEIQSMWDSHPTLDSIRRRRRGEQSTLRYLASCLAPATCLAFRL